MMSTNDGTRCVLVGLVAVILGGCAASAPNKPLVQRAVAKSTGSQPGNTYVIQHASVRTPATERLRQMSRQRDVRRFSASKSAHTQTAQPNRRQLAARASAAQTRESQIRREQAQLRAKYQARYRARKQAAAQKAAAKQAAVKKAAVPRVVKPQVQARKPNAAQRPPLRHYPNQAILTQPNNRQVAKTRTAAVAPQRITAPQNKAQPVANKSAAPRQRQVQLASARRPSAQQTQKNNRQFYLRRWEQKQAEKRLEAKKAEQTVERVIHNAKKQIGSKYVWGGASPKTGFDCSGLVQHSMKKGADVKVPRTAAEQYRAAVKVPEQQATRGDLVFFKTRGKTVSHVGIYLGKNKFVHAPRTGRRITTSNLSGYWKKRFIGFGRIPGACRLPV